MLDDYNDLTIGGAMFILSVITVLMIGWIHERRKRLACEATLSFSEIKNSTASSQAKHNRTAADEHAPATKVYGPQDKVVAMVKRSGKTDT